MDPILFIAYSSALSPVVPLVYSLSKRDLPHELIQIRWLLLASLVWDAASIALAFNRISNVPLGNTFYLLQTLLLLYCFKSSYVGAWPTIRITGIVFAIFFIVNLTLIQGFQILNTYTVASSSVIFIIICLSYFGYLMKEMPVTHVHRTPMVWINIAILLYYSGNLFLFVTNNFFTFGISGNHRTTWILHNFLNITKNLIFVVALWNHRRKTN
jgi:hypothetical protein